MQKKSLGPGGVKFGSVRLHEKISLGLKTQKENVPGGLNLIRSGIQTFFIQIIIGLNVFEKAKCIMTIQRDFLIQVKIE